MNPSGGKHLAVKMLAPLAAYYGRQNVEECVLNREGEIWIKWRRGGWERIEAAELSYDYLRKLCRVLANINGSRFSEDDLPVVSCELPGQPFRFQAIVGSNVRYFLDDNRGAALAIRALTADKEISLGHYGLHPDAKLPGAARFLGEFDEGGDYIERIQKVIEAHETILVSGATSTGKTTFTNRLLSMIHPDSRVITVEDARELTVEQLNRVHLVVPRNRSVNAVNYTTVIDSLMRLTPDWVVCGELSVHNAQPVYTLMGKGHPIMTTVHASTPEQAVQAFVNNMATAGSTLDGATTATNLRALIGCIIQLERRDGKRQVTDIVFPASEVRAELAAREAQRDRARTI